MAPRISSQNWSQVRDIMDMAVIDEDPVLSGDLVRIAECELNETPQSRLRCTKDLRQLLQEEENLKSRVDDAFLLRFLRPAKFDPLRACKMIKRYYKMRVDAPNMFRNKFTPRDQLHSFKYNLTTVLPHKDSQGRTIFLSRPGAWEPSKLSKEDVFMSSLLMMELSIRDVGTLVKGTVVIFDMEGFSWTHIHNLTPVDLHRIVSMVQDCFPCRIKAIHIVNQPRIFTIIWNIVRQFLSTKIASRVHLHGFNLGELYKHVDKQLLPDFLGGTEPIDNSACVEQLLALNDAIFEDGAYGYTDYTENYNPTRKS